MPDLKTIATPSSLALSVAGVESRAGTSVIGASASHAPSMRSAYSTRKAAPIADNLSLNRGGSMLLGDDADSMVSAQVQESQRKNRVKFKLKVAFANMPKPKYTYDVVAPQRQSQAATESHGMELEEDAGDVDERRRLVERDSLPRAVKRGLPIPSRPPAVPFTQTYAADECAEMGAAETLIHEELQAMVMREEHSTISKSALLDAARDIEAETKSNIPFSEYARAYIKVRSSVDRYVNDIPGTLEAKKRRFSALRDRMSADADKAMVAERKTNAKIAALVKRAKVLGAKYDALHRERTRLSTQHECFLALRQSEESEIARRISVAELNASCG